jgi:hypothetical protein
LPIDELCALVGAKLPDSIACVLAECHHRPKDVKALRKHFMRRAEKEAVIAILSNANSMELMQCRHCFGLFMCDAEGNSQIASVLFGQAQAGQEGCCEE